MDPGQSLRWLGGQIDVQVRIRTGLDPATAALWDVALWGVSPWSADDLAYEDISEYVEEVSYQRGAETWDSRFTAGTAVVTLNNTTGLFTPVGDAPQPWGVPFRPGRKVQISVLPDPADPERRETLFTGRIDERTDEYDEAGAALTTVLNLIDTLGELGMNNPPALEVATGVQPTHDRVNAALDVGLIDEADRDIQTGVHTMQTSFLAQTTLEEAQRAADAEGGAFFADSDGKLVFKSRDWLSVDPRSIEIQGYLGFETSPDPGVPEAQIVSGSVQTIESLARIRNDIQFARDEGTMQWVFDTGSMAQNGIRSYSRTDYNNNTDAEVLFLAERQLAAYSESRLRVQRVAIQANDDPNNDALNRLFYETQFGDLVALEVRTLHGWKIPSFTTHVIGIAGRITNEDWTVVFTLDDSLIGAS
jgi:hypothetical protein